MMISYFFFKYEIKKIECFIFIFLLSTLAHSQTNLQWAKSIGGSNLDSPNTSVTDISGNIYTVGSFIGTSDFDPGTDVFNLVAVANRDIFISKLDASGNFLWAKSIGGTGTEYVGSIMLNSMGEIYLSGSYTETVDFDPGNGIYNLTSIGQYDAFVSKLDSSGNLIWVKTFGSLNSESCYVHTFDSSGNIYCTGGFQQTVDFNPSSSVFNMTSSGASDMYILKLDSLGNFVWAKKCGGPNGEVGHRVLLDATENIYITGMFSGTSDFDPGAGVFNLTSSGLQDMFFMKLDAAGNFLWAKKIGGNSYDYEESTIIDSSGNLYTVGYFSNTVDFDPNTGTYNLTSIGGSDVFISKLDFNGNLVWAKRFGSTNSGDEAISIALDVSGNIYVTGGFNNTVDFDPNTGVYNLISIASSKDVFVLKLDFFGDFVWVKTMGGTANDAGESIIVESSGDILISGIFQLTADFNPESEVFNLTSAGDSDIFIIKLGQDDLGIDETIIKNQVNVNPNPNNGIFTIELRKPANGIVYDIFGREIINKRFDLGLNVINLQHINDGVYFLQIVDNVDKEIHKVIINH